MIIKGLLGCWDLVSLSPSTRAGSDRYSVDGPRGHWHLDRHTEMPVEHHGGGISVVELNDHLVHCAGVVPSTQQQQKGHSYDRLETLRSFHTTRVLVGMGNGHAETQASFEFLDAP